MATHDERVSDGASDLDKPDADAGQYDGWVSDPNLDNIDYGPSASVDDGQEADTKPPNQEASPSAGFTND